MAVLSLLIALVLVCLSQLMSVVQSIPGPVDLGQALADRARYPQVKGYFRIEANIIHMANPRGTTKNWMPCDLIPGKCDPKITAAID